MWSSGHESAHGKGGDIPRDVFQWAVALKNARRWLFLQAGKELLCYVFTAMGSPRALPPDSEKEKAPPAPWVTGAAHNCDDCDAQRMLPVPTQL